MSFPFPSLYSCFHVDVTSSLILLIICGFKHVKYGQTLRIPDHPHNKLCTAHLYSWTDSFRITQLFENLVQLNKNRFLYTITYANKSTHRLPIVQPTFHFQEQCTWNILFSHNNVTNNKFYIHSLYVQFIGRNLHRWRTHEYSTFITVTLANQAWLIPGLATLTNKILLYIDNEGPKHFPNFIYFPYEKGKFIAIDGLETLNKILISPYYPKIITDQFPPISLYTASGKEIKYPFCTTNLGLGEINSKGGIDCTSTDSLFHSLISMHNFTLKSLIGDTTLLPTIETSIAHSGDVGLSNIMTNVFYFYPKYCTT